MMSQCLLKAAPQYQASGVMFLWVLINEKIAFPDGTMRKRIKLIDLLIREKVSPEHP
jgi:hypothetical protein